MSLVLSPGVETLTCTGALPGRHLRVESTSGVPVVTVVADDHGNAHVSFVGEEHRVLESLEDMVGVVREGLSLEPGDYVVVDATSGETHGPVRVLAIDDHPDPSLYNQEVGEGYGYITTRDGVSLSVMVRFPDEGLHGPAPWPTVIEYSGYGPSNPDSPQPGTMIANLMGFATVGVNMRGTGCSGGVFDVFSPAQAADGYDVIETLARQDWVLHNKPGMVGLSYPGISQLYVAALRPPSLAAITPLSVIDDVWRQQWPGGTYNSGFTRAWLAQRDTETKVGGMAWDQARIEAGDGVCSANSAIRTLNVDFESFGRAIETVRPALERRRVADLVQHIDVPVYLTGAWQDEQTGSRFVSMLSSFENSPHTKFTLFNGHHPDGFSPMVICRWYEFLHFYVARRIPRVPDLIRTFAPAQFAQYFGYETEIEPDRFAHFGDDFEGALQAYKSEPAVRILFESGAAGEVAGAPGARYEVSMESFPPADIETATWWLGPDGSLLDDRPDIAGADRYHDDPDAGSNSYAQTTVFNDFIQPTVPVEWSHFDHHHRASYETAPLAQHLTWMGEGHVDLWLRPGSEDTSVQATITEIRPDRFELKVQSGYHRPCHTKVDQDRSNATRIDYTFTREDRTPLIPGEWTQFKLPLMPVAHVFRAGSRLRLTLSTPGRDHPFWEFENPTSEGAGHDVGRGASIASSLVLPVWNGIEVPDEYPAADAVRGQPSRLARDITNLSVGV